MKENNILVHPGIDLIQEVRIMHALSESKFQVSIPSKEEWKFKLLKKELGLKYVVDRTEGLRMKDLLKIDHSYPHTSIKNIRRLLIFPHSICTHLRQKWPSERKMKFTFCGQISTEREKVLKSWIKKTDNLLEPNLPNSEKLLNKIIRKLPFFKNFSRLNKYGETYIWSSARGRNYPYKAWDANYYNILLNSKFTLCPSGDFTWSYRFFESILCGAIPVVEEDCGAYEGFRYKYLSSNHKTFKWSQEDADFNYNLCLEKITVPKNLLNEEIIKALKRE